jgi:thaumarchaeosortase
MPPDSAQIKQAIFKLLPLVALAVPLLLLYMLNPADQFLNVSAQDSFQLMWKGRTFLLFFAWLVALEFILGWEAFKPAAKSRARFVAASAALVLPTLYVVAEFYLGLNAAVAGWALSGGVAFWGSMPLAVEYFAFALLFALASWLLFGKHGLWGFGLPILFAVLVGALYTIDNVYPYGEFTPFQLLVPTTASLAAGVLSWMGYTPVPGTENGMPTLQVSNGFGTVRFAIGWPCAGIESLLIFTAVTLLFLLRMKVSWKAKVGYFALGAAVTYFINVMRIVTLFTLGVQFGQNSSQVQMFHYYYGPLYAMAWIVSYPLIILASYAAWRRIRKPRPKPPNPASPESER